MSQGSNLPETRPTTDAYGPDLSNARPVKNPQKELDAKNWNQMKADVAQIASTIARARIVVSNNGSTVAVVRAYGVDSSTVVVTRVSPGVVTVRVPGMSIYDGEATARSTAANAAACGPDSTTPGDTWRVCTSNGGMVVDSDFVLSLY